jgi:hypothetical protein
MAEESAVNYWEVRPSPPLPPVRLTRALVPQKYGNVAFDSTQKAVLTSCVLRFRPAGASGAGEDGFINCCFSFTIRRDTWGIPSMIVGNFIRC